MARFKYDDYWLSKSRKKEIKKAVKDGATYDDPRKVRNMIRTNMHDPKWVANWASNIPKLGAFVSRAYRSSGRFRSAYSFARSEAEFYDMVRYADY